MYAFQFDYNHKFFINLSSAMIHLTITTLIFTNLSNPLLPPEHVVGCGFYRTNFATVCVEFAEFRSIQSEVLLHFYLFFFVFSWKERM